MFDKAFLEALADHFRRGGAKVIERVAKNQPAGYLKICALLVPKYFKVEGTDGAKGAAYAPAGCKANDGNASRMKGNERISARARRSSRRG